MTTASVKKKRTRKKSETGKPEPLYKEAKSEYRLRCIHWLLKEPMRITPLLIKYNEEFDEVSMETMLQKVEILYKRNLIASKQDPQDKRIKLWYAL